MKHDISEYDLKMTQRALELASFGVGLVSPSPLVGCVVVADGGETVGEGTYIYENVTHAEVLALKQAKQRARGATAYVSLEPHAHQGRTKPCTDALIEAGIRRVVCPIEDPNPLVSGKGFEQLKASGIEVVTGIMREEAARLNEKFCVWHQRNRPFVHLKMAMSLDGRIALRSRVATIISGRESARKVQELRHEYDAILIGGNTAAIDDPSLTDRSGKRRRRKLLRVVLDNRLQISPNSTLAQTAGDFPTVVFSGSNDAEKISKLTEKGIEIVQLNARDLPLVLSELKQRDIQSVLVEGGAEVAGAFADTNLIDKYTFFVAPLIIGGNDAPRAIAGNGAVSMKSARLKNLELTERGADYELTGYPYCDE